MDALRPHRAVEADRQILEDGIEGVGDDQLIPRSGGGVAPVLQRQRIGQRAILGDGGRADALADGQLRRGGGVDGLRGGDRRGQTAAGDGDSVDDAVLYAQRRIFVDGGGVDQHGAAAGRHRQARHRQGRGVGNGRGGLQNAVDVVQQRPGHIRQGIQRAVVEGIAAQRIGDGQAGEGRRAGVHQRDGVGLGAAGGIGGVGRRLGNGQHLHQLAYRDVGEGGDAVIGQSRLIGNGCHGKPPEKSRLRGGDGKQYTARVPFYVETVGGVFDRYKSLAEFAARTPQAPLAAKSSDCALVILLLPCRQVLVTRTPVGALAALVGEKTHHFVLVQIHLADIIVIVLVIAVKYAALALIHTGRPLSSRHYTAGEGTRQVRTETPPAGRAA